MMLELKTSESAIPPKLSIITMFSALVKLKEEERKKDYKISKLALFFFSFPEFPI